MAHDEFLLAEDPQSAAAYAESWGWTRHNMRTGDWQKSNGTIVRRISHCDELKRAHNPLVHMTPDAHKNPNFDVILAMVKAQEGFMVGPWRARFEGVVFDE